MNKRKGSMAPMSDLLETIRQAVVTSKHSRYAISKSSGIDQGALCRLVHGQQTVTLETFERLADALDLEIIVRPKGGKRKKGR